MRILHVSSLWPPRVLGGAEIYAHALAEAQRREGHVVGAVTLGVDAPDVVGRVPPWPHPLERYASQPTRRRMLFHMRDLYNGRALEVLDRSIKRFRPDVVHSHSVQGMSGAALARPSQRGVPHVHTLHDYWLMCQRDSMVTRQGIACADLCKPCAAISRVRSEQLRRWGPRVVLAVSEAIAREHRDRGWFADRMRVLYNPVEEWSERFGVRPEPRAPIVFGFLGRLGNYKGVPTLLEAFAAADVGRSRLVLAGSGPLEGLLAIAGPRIDYSGWVAGATKEAWYSSIHCLVVPSEWKDPAPLVVNEARARGIPVIGAHIGGIPELVAPESRPLLFPSGDAAELAHRMSAFAAEPGRYASAPAAAPIGWTCHLAELERAYKDAAHAEVGAARRV